MTPEQRVPQASHDAYSSFIADIHGLASQVNDLHLQAVREHRPAVERIIRSGSRNQQEIERALDRLLDHACVPEGLELFKALCRHYYHINPVATAGYVQGYRELWDSDQTVPAEIESSVDTVAEVLHHE